jgi:hypothetical protein
MAVHCSVISLSKELQQRQLETKRTRVYQKIKGVLDHSPPKINENGEREKKKLKHSIHNECRYTLIVIFLI